MNSPAPQQRPRLPRIAEAAVARARLTVVPPRTRSQEPPRVPFVVLVSLILLAGVVGLLLFNTSMQQASFRETALEQQASDLGAQQEALELEVQDLRSDDRVARLAQQMGLVMPSTPAAVLDLATGEIRGDPQPAEASERLPLDPPPPVRPEPIVRPERPTSDATDRTTRDRRDGVPDRDRRVRQPRLGE